MSISLFSYNIMLLLCALVASLVTFQIMDRDKKWRKKHLMIALLVAVLASGLMYGSVQWFFRADSIPLAMVIWFTPFCFCTYLLGSSDRRPKKLALSFLYNSIRAKSKAGSIALAWLSKPVFPVGINPICLRLLSFVILEK